MFELVAFWGRLFGWWMWDKEMIRLAEDLAMFDLVHISYSSSNTSASPVRVYVAKTIQKPNFHPTYFHQLKYC